MDKTKQTLMSVLGVFALVIVTVATSYAFFSYSRTGATTSTVTSGDISFQFSETESVTIENAFPVADAIGAKDTKNVYEFSVTGNVTSDKVAFTYDITLVSDNTKTVKANATAEELAGDYVKGYFTNDQIKVNLVKNDTEYLFGGENSGVLLSTVEGFEEGATIGSGKIVTAEPLSTGGVDTYKLRMWIDSKVDYSNTASTTDGTDEFNDGQTATGAYSGYTYSLKVKVDSNAKSIAGQQ